MRDLLSVEFFKLFKQNRTYYALAAIFVVEIFIFLGAYVQGSDILDVLLMNLKESFYFEGNLLNGNLLVYLVLNTLWFHLPLLLMIVVADMLTSEYKDRTLQTVMLQPIAKWKYILSKYIVAILFTILVVLFLAVSSFIASRALFGNGDLVVYINGLNFFESDQATWRLIYAFLSGMVSMVFFSIVSLTLAIFFRDSGKTWIIAALFLILNNLLMRIDFGNTLLNRLLFAKLNNSWQYFFYYEIPWQDVYFNNALLLFYSVLIMGVGIYWFQKKDIG